MTENTVYDMRYPVTIGDKIYDTIKLGPIKVKAALDFRLDPSGNLSVREMATLVSASSLLPESIIHEFDVRDMSGLTLLVTPFLG